MKTTNWEEFLAANNTTRWRLARCQRIDGITVDRLEAVADPDTRRNLARCQPALNPDSRTNKNKELEMRKYAEKHNLEFNETSLTAFRNHDKLGNGIVYGNRYYESGYYRDWHCDCNAKNENSFGFGIWPKGNTAVTVTVADWGVAVSNDPNGKARVWGFTVEKKVGADENN